MNTNEEQRRHEKLCAYVLGELESDAERAEVETWLAGSAELRVERARLEATIGLVQEALGASPAADVLSAGARAELSAAAREHAAQAGAAGGSSAPATGAAAGGEGLRDATIPAAPPRGPRRWLRSPALQFAAAASVLGLLYVGWQVAGPGEARIGLDGYVAKNEAPSAPAEEEGQDAPARQVEGLAWRDTSTGERAAGLAIEPTAAPDSNVARAKKEKDAERGEALRELGYLASADEAGDADDAADDADGALAKASEPVLLDRAQAETEADELKIQLGYAGRPLDQLASGSGRAGELQAGQPLVESAPASGGKLSFDQPHAVPEEPRARASAGQVAMDEKAANFEVPPAEWGPGDTAAPHGSGPAGPSAAGPAGPAAPAPAPPPRVAAASGIAHGGPASPPPAPPASKKAKDENAFGQAWRSTNEPAQQGGIVDFGTASTAAQDDGTRSDGRQVEQLLAQGGLELPPAVATGGNQFFLGAGQGAEARGRGDAQLAFQAIPWEQQVEYLLAHCRQAPGETPEDMFYRFWGDNPFELTAFDPLSTFAVDVDTSSYTLARGYLNRGVLPQKEQIRTEEFVNYFDSGVPAPTSDVFAIALECAPSRFGGDPNRSMLRVVVRAKEVPKEERKPVALTFVVDVSGSMKRGGRLELVKHALRLLVAELDTRDSIAIVAFSNEARLVLPPTSADQRGRIESAIYGLSPDGGTNVEAGLLLGYEQALLARDPQAENRVVLLSDGVANVGQTDQTRLTAEVAEHREVGIYLNTVGVGMGNHDDVFLEQLADEGDGVSHYVDSPAEAQRALVDDFTGAFQTIARDVKIQVEFDPSQVASYRLLGYENRAIADADFRNDAVDAGEVGAGHQVTALYELERLTARGPGTLATVRVRYKAPHDERLEDALPEQAMEIARRISTTEESGSFSGTTFGYRRAVVVAQYAELLRRSVHAKNDSFDELIAEAEKLAAERPDPEWIELVALMKRSRELVLAEWNRDDPLLQTIDAVRQNSYLQAQVRELRGAEDAKRLQELESENRALEAEIRELVRRRVEAQQPELREGARRR